MPDVAPPISPPAVPRNRVFVVACVLSVIAHGAIIGSWGSVHEWFAKRARVSVAEARPEAGIDESRHLTVSWIGYDEYKQHIAELAAVDQAAFTTPIGEVEDEEPVPPAPPPSPNAAAPSESTPDETEPGESTAQEAPTENDIETPRPVEATEPPPVPPRSGPEDIPIPARSDPTTDPQAGAPKESSAESAPLPETTDDSQSPAEPGAPSIATGEPKTPRDAEVSDRDSIATSTMDVPLDAATRGRPVARKGIEVIPRWNEATSLQRALPRAVGNPVVELTFDDAGKPANVRLVRGTGSADVDHLVRSSLYRWRARGKDIDSLEDDGTLAMRFRIVFNSRLARQEDAEAAEKAAKKKPSGDS